MGAFSLLNLLISLYLFSYLMEIVAQDLWSMNLWNQVQYLSLPFYPTMWLIVVLLYVRKFSKISVRHLVLLLVIPFLTFLIRQTNDWHHLFYRDVYLESNLDLIYLVSDKAIWYYAYAAYLVIIFFTIAIVLVTEMLRADRDSRSGLILLLIATVLPFSGFLLILFDFQGTGFDYAGILLPFSMILVMLAIFRYDFLGTKSLARNRVFKESQDVLILLDNHQRIIDYNDAASRLFPSLSKGRLFYTVQTLFADHPKLQEAFLSNKLQSMIFLKSVTADQQHSAIIDVYSSEEISGEGVVNPLIADNKTRKKKNTTVYYEIDSTKMLDGSGKGVGVLKTMREVTDKRIAEKKLRYMAAVDEMSGLYNRRYFMELANHAYKYAERYQEKIAVLMIDIDHFKMINDSFGHAVGDRVIRCFGKLILKRMRKTDICGRLGGEEFAIVMPSTAIRDAYEVAETLRQTFKSDTPGLNEIMVDMTISIGIAEGPADTQHFDQMLEQADEALYQAKDQGRNKTVLAKARQVSAHIS